MKDMQQEDVFDKIKDEPFNLSKSNKNIRVDQNKILKTIQRNAENIKQREKLEK